MSAGIRIKGDKELERAFKQLRRDVLRELRPSLRLAAEPVRQEAQSLFGDINASVAAGYKVRVRMRGVAVEQSQRRTTGQHPEFGRLQMTEALEPALDSKQEEVVRKVDLMIALNAKRAGF